MSDVNFKNLDILIEHRDKLSKENKELKEDIQFLLKSIPFTNNNDDDITLIIDKYT
mgnify:CR=1 FL=1